MDKINNSVFIVSVLLLNLAKNFQVSKQSKFENCVAPCCIRQGVLHTHKQAHTAYLPGVCSYSYKKPYHGSLDHVACLPDV